jgi:two-component system OmpR family sensor kinase
LRPFNIWVRASVVTEGAFPEGGYCLIEVQDDGPGILPEVKRSLFTPNVISTTQGGTGIGTRFVKSVADAHHGLAGVESEPGDGALFWMKLPLAPPT